jgi:hypothetical protein
MSKLFNGKKGGGGVISNFQQYLNDLSHVHFSCCVKHGYKIYDMGNTTKGIAADYV